MKEMDTVNTVTLKDTKTGEHPQFPAEDVFICVGTLPLNGAFKNLDITNEEGYVVTDEAMATKIPGIYAAGDIRDKTLRQIVTATDDGSIAAKSVQHYIDNLES